MYASMEYTEKMNEMEVKMIFIGNNLSDKILKWITRKNPAKCVIVTDSRVRKLIGERLFDKIKGIDTILISFKAGEKSKTRKTKAYVEDEMLKHKCGRDTLIIALGGGVVGDLAGFVAATFMRGIPFIQIPTTLMAQADSSIGGKTSINTSAGKNLIGAFHQPSAVFIDIDSLKTLDKRNFVNGLVEIVKHGLIRDRDFFNFLKENMDAILNKNQAVMQEVLSRNVKIKADIVASDEKEASLRKILNFGHTIGHAVEKLSNFNLLHGEAIAIGIVAESQLANKLGILSDKDFIEIKQIFDKMGLSTNIPKEIKTKDIMDIIKIDKKARNTIPEFSLIETIGKHKTFKNGKVACAFKESIVREAIDEFK